MKERELVAGGFYRHFKNKLYQVKCVAYHSETKEKMVVYQALYGDFSVYVRPYDMFMGEVNRVKYPDAGQRYRFEQVFLRGEDSDISADAQKKEITADNYMDAEKPGDNSVISDTGADVTDGEADERLMRFLDAESYAQKLGVLSALKNNLDDKLIDAMAASMDVEILPGNSEERYVSLRKCIQARAKYECTRLR